VLAVLSPSILRPIARKVAGEPAPAFYVDFTQSQTGGFTLTRATTATYFDASGVLRTAASGVQRIDQTGAGLGLLREPARTNRALHSRDLTQTEWVKTDATAAKTQVGIDGVANSASSLTATGANGTVLQALTHTSTERTLAIYLKRLVGTGGVEITLDNGAEWTAVTDDLSAEWARVSKVQTLANPTFGIRLVTSGDSVAVDYVQVEDGHCPTSAIPTTTVAVTRDADVLVLSGAAFSRFWNPSEGTAVIETAMIAAPASSTNILTLSINDATNNERINWFIQQSTGNHVLSMVDGGVAQASIGVVGTANYTGASMRHAAAWRLNSVRAAAVNGTLSSLDTAATIPTVTQIELGAQAGQAAVTTPQYFRSFTYWPVRLADPVLAAVTL
jgi:hypothetical protein